MKKTGTGFNWILVFFLFLGSCTEKGQQDPVQIFWSGKKAIQFFISDRLLNKVPRDSISYLLRIHVQNSPDPVLGDYDWMKHGLNFRPMIPFTRGLIYEIRLRGVQVSSILIPEDAEDLAGNNLERLFDRDLTQPDNHELQNKYRRVFRIR